MSVFTGVTEVSAPTLMRLTFQGRSLRTVRSYERQHRDRRCRDRHQPDHLADSPSRCAPPLSIVHLDQDHRLWHTPPTPVALQTPLSFSTPACVDGSVCR